MIVIIKILGQTQVIILLSLEAVIIIIQDILNSNLFKSGDTMNVVFNIQDETVNAEFRINMKNNNEDNVLCTNINGSNIYMVVMLFTMVAMGNCNNSD